VKYIRQNRKLKIIAVVSNGNRYMLLIETKYGLLRSLLMIVDAMLIVGFGWLIRHIKLLSAGTERDRTDEVSAGLEDAVEKLLSFGTMPGDAVQA
jgi:hypothetical protein